MCIRDSLRQAFDSVRSVKLSEDIRDMRIFFEAYKVKEDGHEIRKSKKINYENV